MSRGMAMAKRYGPGSTMLTLTPYDINNPTSFRLACNSLSNKEFPAVANEKFFDSLKMGAEVYEDKGNIKIPIEYTDRLQAAKTNPVAVALEFRAIVENILSILIGCPLDFQPGTNSNQKRTWYFKSTAKKFPHHKGVFGYVTAYFGCIETHVRGALLFHVFL